MLYMESNSMYFTIFWKVLFHVVHTSTIQLHPCVVSHKLTKMNIVMYMYMQNNNFSTFWENYISLVYAGSIV